MPIVSVLIVEDNDDDALLLSRAIRRYAPGAVTFDVHKTLDAGLCAVRERHYDLVILDYGLGPLNSMPILHAATMRAIPVVVVTGYHTEELNEMVMREGAAAAYSKEALSQERLRDIVGSAIGVGQEKRSLLQLALYEPELGIPNRFFLFRRLAEEISRGSRGHAALSVLMIDVDYFKRYNDAHGHAAGDECLRRVAALLAASVRRPSDLVARYGGEEFAAVLPMTSLEGACQVGERMRAAVEVAEMPGHQVTVSIGVHTVVPDFEMTPTTLLHEADCALYRAKESGRNCVVATPYAEWLAPKTSDLPRRES